MTCSDGGGGGGESMRSYAYGTNPELSSSSSPVVTTGLVVLLENGCASRLSDTSTLALALKIRVTAYKKANTSTAPNASLHTRLVV